MIMRDASILARYMRIYGERKLSHYDLNFVERLIIMHLAAEKQSTQSAISQIFDIDKGTVAKSVADLESRRFIERSTDPQDRRSKLLTLTEKGERLVNEMREVADKMNDTLCAGMAPEQIEATATGLAIMAKNIRAMRDRL